MANPQANNRGRSTNPLGEQRRHHRYDDPTTGRIFTAVFVQPLTAETRTVEIVRFRGADAWKARVPETRTIMHRLGQQVEFAGDQAACTDITDYLKRQGMRIIRQWEAMYPEWSAAAVSPAPRPMIPGGVQQ